MGFEYVGVEEAIGREGLRMVVVGGVPSPWGEAAKGLFHLKNLDWAGVRLVHDSDALLQWAGERTCRTAGHLAKVQSVQDGAVAEAVHQAVDVDGAGGDQSASVRRHDSALLCASRTAPT